MVCAKNTQLWEYTDNCSTHLKVNFWWTWLSYLWVKKYIDQEPPYLIRQTCVHVVGGDQNKEFRGNALFLREKGPWGGIRIYCYCIFHIDQKAKIVSIRSNSSNLINQLVFCWTVISHQSFSSFPSTSLGALGLFTFFPQCTVHNMRIYELGVPVYSSLLWVNPSKTF